MYENELVNNVEEGKEYKKKYWKNLLEHTTFIFILSLLEKIYM